MDHLPSLRLLVTFDTVCRLGSMQRAAKVLNVSPPAVTQAIHLLEQEIGVPLMNRSSKPAVPTEAGERLAWATRSGLASIENTINDIRISAELLEQQVTVRCTIGVATHWLMPRLPAFYALCPDIAVNVQAPPSDRPVLSPGIDLALRYGRGDWKDGETVKLFDEVICPVGTPEVIKRAQAQGGLLEAPLIDVRNHLGTHWDSWPSYLKQKGIARHMRAGHVFDNYVQAVQAALDSRGLMLGWRSITQRLVDEGALVAWPDGDHDFGTSYFISRAFSSRAKDSTTKFLDWVLAEVKPAL